MRNYRIRGATQEVANSIQEARTRAIMRNATGGISFAVVAIDRYRVIYDDPLPNPADPANPSKRTNSARSSSFRREWSST